MRGVEGEGDVLLWEVTGWRILPHGTGKGGCSTLREQGCGGAWRPERDAHQRRPAGDYHGVRLLINGRVWTGIRAGPGPPRGWSGARLHHPRPRALLS